MRLAAGAIRRVKVPFREMPAPGSQRQLRHREVGWEAARGEHAVRRMTNTIRPYAATSLLGNGEVQTGARAMPGDLLEVCQDPAMGERSHAEIEVPEVQHAGRAAEKRCWGASGGW